MFGIAPLASLQVTPIESACKYAEGRDNSDDHDDLCRHRTNSIWFIGAIKRDSSPPDFDLDQTECRKFTMAWNQGANFARAHICVRSIRLPSCRGILLKEPLSLSEALVCRGRDALIWPIADCEEARNVRGGLSSTGTTGSAPVVDSPHGLLSQHYLGACTAADRCRARSLHLQ